MEHRLIQSGAEYGYREKPKAQSPLEHVRVLERVRGQWRVEWIEPNAGLQAFVRSSNIVVPWKERKAFLKEESDWKRLREVSELTWPGHDHPVDDAVTSVLEATGEHVNCYRSGVLTASDASVLERISARAHLNIEIRPPGHVDRDGKVHLPFEQALVIAKAFAKSESDIVLASIASEEARVEEFDRYSTEPTLVLMHLRYMASWSLVRQWAGFDAAREERDNEVERLRRVIRDFELTLRRAGHDDLAAQLERKLDESLTIRRRGSRVRPIGGRATCNRTSCGVPPNLFKNERENIVQISRDKDSAGLDVVTKFRSILIPWLVYEEYDTVRRRKKLNSVTNEVINQVIGTMLALQALLRINELVKLQAILT